MEDEELIFKRFPDEKQDQVRGLVNYATLMGLTGKDLVSIGGKLDRIAAARKRIANMQVIETFNCLPIGTTKNTDDRFKLKTTTGTYNFEKKYSDWIVTSVSTKKTKRHSPDIWDKDLPKASWDRRHKYAILLDIASGELQLNF